MEWLFIVIATLTLLGLLGTSIERLISVKNSFNNFTDFSGDGDIVPSAIGPIRGEEGEYYKMSESNRTRISDCDEWTCLNDFIFSVLLLVNLGKQLLHECVLMLNRLYVFFCVFFLFFYTNKFMQAKVHRK